MKAVGKELKWALCGFIAGFVLCYIFIGALKTPTAQQRVALIQTTTGASPKPFIIHLDGNGFIPARVDHPRDNPFKRNPELRNVPRGALPESYSVDLIDGRDQKGTVQ